jgi:DNA-directed RNA polymerase sigma subunit (sigma70/sigma32)
MASLQAGKMGVLDGAEKFDSRKGCKFSTYVKYWIRKGMLALLAENSGVTLLPVRLSLQPFADDMLSSLFPVRKKKRVLGCQKKNVC